jgi:hypothetical protein
MATADADGVYRTSSEALPATPEERQQVMNRGAEEVGRRTKRYWHFLEHDPDGAWVAVDGDRVAGGKVRRGSLPVGLKTREGTEADLELAAEVDRLVRGAAHGPDLEFMLRTGSRLLVSEGSSGQGYAVVWEGSPALLAATTPEVAIDLLWSCLAESKDADVEVHWITSSQNWALPVVLGAGLSLSPAGPICVRGALGPLTPYLPSGPFL